MKKDLRNFGITLGTILAVIGAVLYFRQKPNSVYFLMISLALLLPALIFPQILKMPYRFWMKLSDIMGWIMTRVILTILFYLVFTPTALILKVIKKDLLNLKIKPNQSSYWLEKKTQLDKQSILKQY